MNEKISQLLRLLDELLAALFYRETEKKHAWLGGVWLAGLYALGVYAWGRFLNWGKIPFDWLDWAEINAPRTAFLKDAMMLGVLPLHMPDASALREVTDRFMCLPDVLLSPDILLLRFMEVGPFFLVHTLILYTLGALGLLALRKKFNLSLAAFTGLFLLFNFNGHILAHYSVGHTTWGGYLLFPWLFLLAFQFLEGDYSWKWVAKTAGLLLFMYLQGSFHQFVWSLMLLGLLGLTARERFIPALKALVFSCLLSLVRILPPVLLLGKFDQDYLGGYPTAWDMLMSMVSFKFPAESFTVQSMLSDLAWWEYNLYIGLAGALWVGVFGLYLWARRRDSQHGYPAFWLPIVVLTLFSLGRIYRVVRYIPIPLLSGERASIRMLIVPAALLMVLAALEMQHWLNQRRPGWLERVGLLGGLLMIAHDLWQHLKVWQVDNAYLPFDVTPVDLNIKVVANRPDPPYITMVAVGAALSLLTLIFLLVMARRESRGGKG
ncbi:MAG: hypothetical protein GYA48_08715 [Chloroflexi bacterium]|nr:hypothetical protein [Chloroflexota bacterium]